MAAVDDSAPVRSDDASGRIGAGGHNTVEGAAFDFAVVAQHAGNPAVPARREGTEFIAVILKAPSSAERFEAAKLLLNYGFAGWQTVDALPDGALPPVAVTLGTARWLQPELSSGTRLLLRRGEAAGLRKELALPERVEAPVEKGQALGSLRVLDGEGRLLAEISLTAPEAVPRLGWTGIFRRCLRTLLTGRVP